MPKVTKTLGTGMTERGVVVYDWAEPGDVEAQVRAAIETFDRSSFARLSARLTALATAILAAANLPSDPARAYVVRPDGTWVVLDESVDLAAEQDSDLLPLDQAVLTCGHQPDSPEGYAARVLVLLQRAKHQAQAGSPDEALATAFAAGELANEAGMKELFERGYLTGEKVRDGGQRGHEQTYGTAAEKAARRRAYLEAFDRLRANKVGKMKAYRAVAKRFGVSLSTVQRAIKDANDQA